MIYKKVMGLLYILFFFLFQPLFAGFSAGTIVKKSDAYACIKDIQVGDYVECLDKNQQQVVNKVLAVKKKIQSECICITLETNEKIIVSKKQRFYLPEKKIWQRSEQLELTDRLQSKDGSLIGIVTISAIDDSIMFYDIAVESCHN